MLLAIAMLLVTSFLQAAAPAETENTPRSQLTGQISAIIESKLLEAAQQGDANAQFDVGDWFRTKPNRSEDDTRRAAEWFRRSALQGNLAASFKLAGMMAIGEGVPQDDQKAAIVMAATAKAGYPIAQRAYGLFLEAGLGVKQDFKEALYWYDLAATNGDPKGRDMASKLRGQLAAASRVNSPFPAVPAAVPGRVTCNTRCVNGDCYRTYGDGRQVHFQARQVWDPMQNAFAWDSGGC